MSRFDLTLQYIDDSVLPGTLRWGLWKAPEIDVTDPDRYAVVLADLRRPDLIAYKMYGDVRLWWVIMLVNNIANPLEDMVVGRTLIVPRIDEVTRALMTPAERS